MCTLCHLYNGMFFTHTCFFSPLTVRTSMSNSVNCSIFAKEFPEILNSKGKEQWDAYDVILFVAFTECLIRSKNPS